MFSLFITPGYWIFVYNPSKYFYIYKLYNVHPIVKECLNCTNQRNSSLKFKLLMKIVTQIPYFPGTSHITAVNIFAHAVVFILMFLDFLILGHPIKIKEAIYPITYGVTYSIFSLFYFLAGGTDRKLRHKIYPLLDWKLPGQCVIVIFVSVVVAFTFHSMFYGIYRLRKSIKNRVFDSQEIEIKMKENITDNNNVV